MKFIHKDGINLREKKVKRGYLRKDETNILLMTVAAYQLLMGKRNSTGPGDNIPAVEKWEKSGILTKEQAKNLKMATTYLRKFIEDFIENNLDRKTKETVYKRIARWEIRLADDYQIQKIQNMLNKTREVQLSIEEFSDVIESHLVLNCKGCTKDRCDCRIREFYEENFVPPVEEMGVNPNNTCEYSY